MASDKPQCTLGPWTMSEGQRDTLLDATVDGVVVPGLFARAGFTEETAAARYGRVEGFKLVGIMIGICNTADEKALCAERAGDPVSVSDQDGNGGQLGYLIRLQKAAAAAGLTLVVGMIGSVVENVMGDEDGVDWVKAHRTLDKAEAFFAAEGVELPPYPERKVKAKPGSGEGEPDAYPSK